MNTLADEMNLSEEDRRLTMTNGTSLLYNRISWAKAYLMQAGLLERVGRGVFVISPAGRELLAKKPNEINTRMLQQYHSFNVFITRHKKDKTESVSFEKTDLDELSPKEAIHQSKDKTESVSFEKTDSDELSPEEAIHQSLEKLNLFLAAELLERIVKANPTFFEKLIIKLLVTMGYSSDIKEGWEHTGKSGDDGVDGIIYQDTLGIDKIYIQAKRYAADHLVTAGDIRNFVGALDIYRATKGVFVTTSNFTADAGNTIKKTTKNIVLIDGKQLTQLMIKYNVGCKTKEVIDIKKADEDFFEEM